MFSIIHHEKSATFSKKPVLLKEKIRQQILREKSRQIIFCWSCKQDEVTGNELILEDQLHNIFKRLTICHILSAKVKTHSLRRGEFSEETNSYYIKNKIKYLLPRLRGLAYRIKMSFVEICDTQDMLFLWLET